MAAPLSTEKVLRGALLSLQRGGVISSGADVAKLEAIPNNATAQDISDILDTIVFGGVAASTDVIRGDEDVNVFVDADDSDHPLVQPRYFRVADDQSDPPVTDPTNEILTAAKRGWSATDNVAELIVGPRTTIATGNHRATIKVGATPSIYYGNILGGPDVVNSGLAGMSLNSKHYVGIQADAAIVVGNNGGTVLRGGWNDPKNTASFNVGDFLAGTPEPLAIEAEDVGGTPMYTIRSVYDGAAVRRTYFRGSNVASDYRCFFSMGGKAGETWGDPNNFNNPIFMVAGDNNSTTANAAYIYDRKTNRAAGSEIFTIKAATAAGPAFHYLRVLNSADVGVFSVKGDGTVSGPVGYTTGPADVAELVAADAEYDPGTVLAIQGGSFTKTTDYQQTNVAGVVATQPGLLLGENNSLNHDGEFPLQLAEVPSEKTMQLLVQGDVVDSIGQYIRIGARIVEIHLVDTEGSNTTVRLREGVAVHADTEIYAGITKQQNLNQMAITGIVPVWCSTERGDILGNGEFLVSGPDGCAVVDYSPKPGTIIGKAKGKLQSDGSEIVKGKVEVLVNLQ